MPERIATRRATILVARTCPTCGELLPASAFRPRLRGPGNKTSRCSRCEARPELRRRHGLFAAEKTAIAIAQDGCAICGRPDPGGHGWTIDHDRNCCPGDQSCADCRRGVLCTWCNTALGYAADDPEVLRRMADYLETGTRLVIA